MPTATTPRPRQITRKAFTPAATSAPATSIKVEPEGIVRAIVAVTGVVDAVNDLIVPGGFAYTLKKRRPKVVDDHEWPKRAGRVLAAEEWFPGDPRLPKQTKDGQPWPAAAGALVATMQYNLNTEAGRESYEWVRFYAESNEAEFSIGYRVPDGKARLRGDGVRIILQVDLFEFSHVLFGAAPLSMALEVKSMTGATGGQIEKPGIGAARQVEEDDEDETPPPAVNTQAPWEDDTKTKARMEAKSAAAVIADAQGRPFTHLEGKAMSNMKGSYEERADRIRDALRDLFNAQGDSEVCFVSTVSTYPTEVIAQVYYKDDSEKSFLVPYTYDDATATVDLGAPSPVALSLVAEPETDGLVRDQGEEALEQIAVVDPMIDGLAGAAALAGMQTKVGRKIREKFLDLAAALSGKSYADDEDDEEYVPEPEGDEDVVAEEDADTDAPEGSPEEEEAETPEEEAAEGPEDGDADDEDSGTVTIDPDEHFATMDALNAAAKDDDEDD